MICPECQGDSRIKDSRYKGHKDIVFRSRECLDCHYSWPTQEINAAEFDVLDDFKELTESILQGMAEKIGKLDDKIDNRRLKIKTGDSLEILIQKYGIDSLRQAPLKNEILKHITTGLTQKSIAKTMSLPESTVRNHLASIYRKAEVSNQFGLMVKLYNIEKKLDRI